MSIQSLYTNFSLFLLPSQATKPLVAQIKNPPRENTQRSGMYNAPNSIPNLPTLLTHEIINNMFPGKSLTEGYRAYFNWLCEQSISSPWGIPVRLFSRQFAHIVSDNKGRDGRGVFSSERASYLSYLIPLLTENYTQWFIAYHHNRNKGNVVTKNRMIGNIPGTPFVLVLANNGKKFLEVITAYPANNSLNTIINATVIANPATYFRDQKGLTI